MLKKYLVWFFAGLLFGTVLTGLVVGRIYGRSPAEVSDLARRYDQLSRNYTARQQQLERNLTECIGYVENARAVVERTGENASRAGQNIREAIAYIREGIEERKNLESELSRIRATLYRTRDMGGKKVE